jgi:Uncharacterised MFS-type transporter YbfB
VIFMVAGHTILRELTSPQPHMVGWAYGGVGAGIALSGVLVAVIKSFGDWKTAWWAAAALAGTLLAVAWTIGTTGPRTSGTTAGSARRPQRSRHRRWFALLAGSYFLEGAGYIVAGTFLVAAISATGPPWLSDSVWTIVGLAAVPRAQCGPR